MVLPRHCHEALGVQRMTIQELPNRSRAGLRPAQLEEQLLFVVQTVHVTWAILALILPLPSTSDGRASVRARQPPEVARIRRLY